MLTLLLVPALCSSLASAAGVSASSTGETEDGRHPASLAVDGLLTTAWAAEGGDDAGPQWIELDLGRPTELHGVSLWGGNIAQGTRSFREYGRPRVVRILVDGKEVAGPVRLQDEVARVDIPVEATGRRVRVVIDESFKGYVFDPVFVAEVAINFPDLGSHGQSWQAWLQSPAAARKQEAFEQELRERYDAYKADEFGDRDALAWIMDAAAEGAPYIRQEAQRRVPIGFRAQAIPSSEEARIALRKLKDPNAIPALEMAMLRSTGEEAERIRDTVEIFRAYQELIGNQNRTAPPWGETGFWRGALQSFGEPLAIERDAEGNLYVADTGNNRVQRFGENGLVNRTWGPPPEITDTWFQEGRPYYVSGSRPGDEPGAFLNPLDVELIPGKDGTGFAVLDAAGRVQVFDASGAVTAAWTVDADNLPDPGVGGEGYLAWSPKRGRLYAFLEDTCHVFDLEGTELDSFEIEDGTPSAVEILPNGRLLLAFRGEVVRYDDGFRHSVVIDEQQLGRGFEDLDLSLDEKGRVWVVTDDAVAYRFKKPGKLDYQVRLRDHSLSRPRFAVYDDMLWITTEDHIEVIDAAQAWYDAQQQDEAVRADELDL
ncbi:MAG: hypothetical protein D6798_16770 [Deltaproteobacteria bacterium]|nr:MAG: hypothetical protein D6798_16770 [Deltaproteobacteria bacterium]